MARKKPCATAGGRFTTRLRPLPRRPARIGQRIPNDSCGPRAAVPRVRQVEPGQPSLKKGLKKKLCGFVPAYRSPVEWETNMSAPVQRDDSLNSDDARLYAPPW